MLFRAIVFALLSAMIVGCAKMIPTEPNDGISINRVVERVKCELGRALNRNKKLSTWAGVITLTLEVDQTGSVIPSSSISGPFLPGAYAVDFSLGATAKSIQTALVNVYFPVFELSDFSERCPIAPRNRLEDSLGLQSGSSARSIFRPLKGAYSTIRTKPLDTLLSLILISQQESRPDSHSVE